MTYIINSSVASGETQRTYVDDQKRRKYSTIKTVLVKVKTDYDGLLQHVQYDPTEVYRLSDRPHVELKFHDSTSVQYKLYLRIPSDGLNEPVKNSHDRERKAIRYQFN